MTRLLITGATGFIGRLCLKAAAGFGELHAVSREARGGDGVVWHRADLREPAQAAALVRAVKPTHLLHSAWIATPGVYIRSPENLDWLTATVTLARAFGETGGQRFVGIGSSAEYAPGNEPCAEDTTPIRPVTIYGQCKVATWLGVQAAARHHGFSAAWGRVFLPYGPGDAVPRLIPVLIASLRAGKPIETTEGRQRRDFVFATDAADLLVRMLRGTATGGYNVGSGRGVPVRQAIEMLADRVGASHDLLRFGARPLAEGEPMELVADMKKVESDFGWRPATTLEDGLDWAVANTAG